VVAKNGLKLHPANNVELVMRVNTGRLGGAMSMPMLAAFLSEETGRAVLDQTALRDYYQFNLEWAPEGNQLLGNSGETSTADDRPSLFTALQQQLGLKLESLNAPGEILVIDHADKPSEN
jgi:bla regulator protein BlaR1